MAENKYLDLEGLDAFKNKLVSYTSENFLLKDGSNGTNGTLNNLINKLPLGDSAPKDADYYITQYTGGGTSNTSYYRRPHSKLFEYISGKMAKIIKGTGATTVVSDANGVITINSTDTNTDTKVTSVANHYTPTADASSALNASLSPGTSTWGSTSYITGIQRDSKGHITGITSAKLPANPNTNTHYTTHLYAGSGTAANTATTNGNTKLTLTDDSTVRNSITIKGAGATTVASDANGVITINSTNTTYTHPTTTALTGKPAVNQTPEFGDSVTVSQVTSNNLGHVVTMNDRTIKIPNTLATSSKPGLMSGNDKVKLDNIDEYIINVSVFQGSEFPGETKLSVINNKEEVTFNTLPVATYMYSGLMSSEDKSKFNKLYDDFYESEQVILSYDMSYANPLRAAFTNTTSNGSADIGRGTIYYIEIANMLKDLKTKLDSDSSITGGKILLNFHDSTKSECYYLEMPSKGTINIIEDTTTIGNIPDLYLTNRGGYRQKVFGSDNMVYTGYTGDSKYTTTRGWTKATTSADGLMSATDKAKLDGLKNYSNATDSTAGLMSATDKEKFDFLSKKCSGITFTFSGSNQKFVIDGETVTLVSGKEYPYLWDLKASSMTGAYTISTSRAKYNFCNEMINMFEGMSGLTSLNLTDFDSTGVINMGRMFFGCSGLTSLDLKNLNTSKVTNMQGMFYNCSGLTSLEIYNDSTSSKFITSMVTNMSAMFQNCSNLTTLNLFNIDSSNVTTMSTMFSGCSKLTTLTFDALNLGGVRISNMFRNCSSLTELTGLYNVDSNLDLSACPLTVSSAVNVISSLAAVTKTTTLKLKASTYSSLTAAQIKVATDKGWTVTSV